VSDLTEKQRRFVEAFTGEAQGNATKAAKLAGYSGDEKALAVRGAEIVRNRKVQQAIEEARASVTSEAIATREERQTFLTRTMRDGGIEPKDRIKACEVLGKMQGDFIEKHEVKHEGRAVVIRLGPDK
jgi:phage terminase small subunit